MKTSNNFWINTLIFLTGAISATVLLFGDAASFFNFGWVLIIILVCTAAFLIVNRIKVKFDFLTFSLLFAYLSVTGSLFLKYDQGFLLFFIFFIFTGLIYSLKSNAFRSNFLTRYFIGSFTYFYLKLKAIGKYAGEQNASNHLKNVRFEGNDLTLTIILFMVFGLPLILVVLGLLGSVNPDFANIISWELIGKVIFGTVVFAYLASELYLLKILPGQKKLLKSATVNPNIDGAKVSVRVIGMIFVILNIFYLFFVGADLTGELSDVQKHFESTNFRSFSEYSVSRFWALIWVSLINLGLIYLLTKPFKKLNAENSKFLRPFTKINIGITILMTFGLIFSTLSRLGLYVNGYGLTNDRVYGITFTVLLGIILVFFGIGIYAKKYSSLHLKAFALVILYFGIMHLIPMQYFTNKVNYELYKADAIKVFSVEELTNHSNDVSVMESKERVIFGENYCIKYGEYFSDRSSEKYLVAMEVLKEKHPKITAEEKTCLKTSLERINASEQEGYNGMRNWNLMKFLARERLKEFK